jgi:4-hydroxy-2-oxoheptanedioate aldolase
VADALGALQRLRNGEAVFGLFQTMPEPAITELAIWCGYDFIVIDCEHGVADERAQLDVLRSVAATRAFALVRTRPHDQSAVARYLDFGADGVLVPDVRSAGEAQRIAFAATKRWTGGLRGDRYGLGPPGQIKHAPLVIALIEAPEGVRNTEAILDVAGIDGAIVGSGDLSTHLGRPGDFASPAYLSAVDQVERAVRARGKILGSKIDPHLPLSTALERGHRLILVGRDMPLVRQAFLDALAAVSGGARSPA